MRIEIGKTYITKEAGRVVITEDLGAGRKRFIAVLIDHPDKKEISYFRNGIYSNATKGYHPYDIMCEDN